MMTIHRAATTEEADIVRSFLESHGIDSVIQGYHHRSLLGFLGPYIACNVMVSEEDAEEARRLIAEMLTGPLFREQSDRTFDRPRSTTSPEGGGYSKDLLAKAADPLSPEEIRSPPEEVPPRSAKRPIIAFFLAFTLPGLGGFYLGRRELGGWLLSATAVCLFVLLFETASEVDVYLPYAAAGLLGVFLCDFVVVFRAWRRRASH